MNANSKQGFTLVEISAAVVLLVMALALALAGYMFSLKNINQGDVQNELDIDVQLAMERLKRDLRLSSLDSMFYYPVGAGPYEAISFPLAEDSDGDGVLEQDSDGNILWDETVIYHIRPGDPNKLVKTTFKPRDNSLSDAHRQTQLEDVVLDGDGDETYNGQNASSHVIFGNLLDWEINPKAGRFDAYSPVLTRDSSSLGYILLDPGTHEFTFKAIGKNSRSTDYKIGIDQLFVSPSSSAREAEAQLPASAQSGATAVAQYMPGGSWKGNYQLYFPATVAGNSFSLKLNNDQWEETNFGAMGYEAKDTEFIFDDTLNPKDFIVQLRGNGITWKAEQQTGALSATSVSDTTLKGSTVAVHINGSELGTNGNWMAYNGRKCQFTFQASTNGNLLVKDVYIGKSTSSNTTVFALSGSPAAVSFSGSSESPVMDPGASETSDWIDFEINTTNNYLVVFTIKGDADKCYPMAWENQRTPSNSNCLVDTNETTTVFALKSIATSYPEEGTYTSQIFDTHLSNQTYGDISWNDDVPEGTSLFLNVRTGNQPDLSDAPDWDTISNSSVNPRVVGASNKRYVQFRAVLQSDTDGERTPKLKDMTIKWGGQRQLVDIGGIFTKGPDYGMFEISVDGDPLRSALIVDLEIYKDILVMNKESRRITSSLKVDLTPRNSGK